MPFFKSLTLFMARLLESMPFHPVVALGSLLMSQVFKRSLFIIRLILMVLSKM